MPTIQIHTTVNAPIERVFDLARSIDLHVLSTKDTEEEVVEGKSSGLLELGDKITWGAVHLGFRQTLTSQMTGFDRPYFFADRMLKGAFKTMLHEHYFQPFEEKTVMVDVLTFTSPLGVLGRFFNAIYLSCYMENFIKRRNAVLKRVAESAEAERYLPY